MLKAQAERILDKLLKLRKDQGTPKDGQGDLGLEEDFIEGPKDSN